MHFDMSAAVGTAVNLQCLGCCAVECRKHGNEVYLAQAACGEMATT